MTTETIGVPQVLTIQTSNAFSQTHSIGFRDGVLRAVVVIRELGFERVQAAHAPLQLRNLQFTFLQKTNC